MRKVNTELAEAKLAVEVQRLAAITAQKALVQAKLDAVVERLEKKEQAVNDLQDAINAALAQEIQDLKKSTGT